MDESSVTGGGSRSFSDRVLRLLERVEHRVATAPAEREAAFRLRFEAYQKIDSCGATMATGFTIRGTTTRPTPG